jgi:hypothetical protein
MSDPFAGRRGKAFLSDQMPDWTSQAACRDKVTVEGQVWEAAFDSDEVSSKAKGPYAWDGITLDVMAVCARCPVRDDCLQYGFDSEESRLLGVRPGADEDLDWVIVTLQPKPSGIYGGVPGRERERLGRFPDKVARANAWFLALSQQRGWSKPANEEVA